MKYTLWKTGHQMNDTVMEAFRVGTLKHTLDSYNVQHTAFLKHRPLNDLINPAISYGVLRGTGTIFKHCRKLGLDFWEIDRGYFKANHFDGYYRISKNNTRHTYNPDAEQSLDRWKALDIELKPWRGDQKGGCILLCPPTDYVREFFGISEWEEDVRDYLKDKTDKTIIVRDKSSPNPLQWDLDRSDAVITFNSNVGIEALRQGIRTYATHAPDMPHLYSFGDYKAKGLTNHNIVRAHLFATLANNQFTLDEFKGGLWFTP